MPSRNRMGTADFANGIRSLMEGLWDDSIITGYIKVSYSFRLRQ
jgi:hypothetical protein